MAPRVQQKMIFSISSNGENEDSCRRFDEKVGSLSKFTL
jgi:hypothetical protein